MAKIKELKEQNPSYKIDVIDVLSQMTIYFKHKEEDG